MKKDEQPFMNERCVIVSAADIHNYEKIKTYFAADDFYIFCDGGLKHQQSLEITPDLIVGDFDSYTKPDTQIPIIQLPHEKDDTDTFFAVKEAVKRGYKNFLLIGGIGNRLDHSLCNLSVLLYLDSLNLSAIALDDYSEMQIAGKKELFISDSCSYFSLMNLCGDVKGVTIKNAKYPLENGTIKSTWQYGISNEVLKGKTASVKVKKGKLLLLKIW